MTQTSSKLKGNVSSANAVSVFPGPVVPAAGLAEADIRAPDDTVMCGRLKNSEILCRVASLLSHLEKSQSV